MKYFAAVFFTVLLCLNMTEAQTPTYAGLPGPENVLVVYNSLDQTSTDVKNYYQLKRGIPENNICPLISLPMREILNYNGEDHVIKIVQSGDIIQDSTQAEIDSANSGYQSSFHAWEYFYDHIAVPIKAYITSNNLTSTIRYIVLCKGIPYKIQAMGDWSGIGTPQKNVSLQSLLSVLNNEPYYTTLLNLYNGANFSYANPYYMINNEDYYYLDYRFLPDFYSNMDGIKLSYLVTRLDGLSYSDVVQMIDNSVIADTSGLRTWILDYSNGYGPSFNVADLLNALDFEVYYDNSPEFITNNNLYNDNEVMFYSSGGHNSGMREGYIQNLLTFNYAPGAAFNTFESFNGNSFGEIKRRAEHGLLSEFIYKGGSGGVCYPWEPGGSTSNCIVSGKYFTAAYALGYNLVDALYMNIPNFLFQYAVAGDPLTRIYKIYKSTIVSNDTTINSGDIEERIIVPIGKTLTIASGSVINFKRNAFLRIDGNIVIEPGAELHFRGVSQLILNNAVLNANISVDFEGYSRLLVNGHLIFGENFVLNLYDNSEVAVGENGDIALSSGSILNAYNNSIVSLRNINFIRDITFNFFNNTRLNAINVHILENSEFNFYNTSSLTVADTLSFSENVLLGNLTSYSCGKLLIDRGTELHFNNGSVSEELKISGVTNNPVILYGNTLNYNGVGSVVIDHCNFNNGCTFNTTSFPVADTVSVRNCTFNADSKIYLGSGSFVNIKDCEFDNIDNTPISIFNQHYGDAQLNKININSFGINRNGISIYGMNTIFIDSCNIYNGGNGILIRETADATISNTNIIGINTGITIGERPRPEEELVFNEIQIENNIIQALLNGIIFYETNFNSINVKSNNLQITGLNPTVSTIGMEFNFAIGTIQNTFLKENVIVGGNIGMQFTNANNLTVIYNSIKNSQDGMVFSNNNNINCVNNQINNNLPVKYTGLFFNSSSGNLRGNEITGYSTGLWLANSSPYLSQNIIHGNIYNGIYIGEGSAPYMDRYFHLESGCEYLIYSFSGFNRIYENGGVYSQDDGSEIYFRNSNAFVSDGCNTIADNRSPNPPLLYNTQTLLNGTLNLDGRLNAIGNYWGNNPLYGGKNPRIRFGNLNVDFDPYLEDPCTTVLDGDCGWIISDNDGNIIDTLYSSESSGGSTDIKILYSTGDNYFQNNQLNDAKTVYNQIVTDFGDSIQSISAYCKLLSIAYLQQAPLETLEQIRNIYLQKSTESADSLLCYSLNQLSRLSLIAEGQYGNAIDQFDEIVQQQPGTEKALYAEIDAYTTALLEDNGLGKSSKYYLDNSTNFGGKVNTLLKSFLSGEYQSQSVKIPGEFILYQNYPNPFNPMTTIRYAVPKTINVEIDIFNILGQEVYSLVNNEIKNPGFYEVQFNGSNFASGVYLFRLKAGEYSKTGKMLLLK